MNIYENNQNKLFDNIKKLLNIASYQNVKYKLNSLIKDNNFEENEIIIIKKIINLIKQPQQLLNLDNQVRFKFCNFPNINHEIFKSLNINREIIETTIQSIGNNTKLYKELLEQFNIYSKSQNDFCYKLVDSLYKKSIEEPLDLLNELPLLFNEKFEKFEILSLKLAYEMASYDPIQFKYIRKNESGLSIGTVINDVYFKYDKGGQLLKPAKEFAIYQLFKDLFPLASSTFVAPTQLIIIDNLKILNEESTTIKKLGLLKTQHNLQDVEKILEIEPEFRAELNNDLKNCQPFFIQTSLFTKGQTFLNFLKDNKDADYTQIDMESYSSHIIISLLVIHSDYKADNLILEEGSNKIIGIDNDQCLDYNEIEHINSFYFPYIRNILFTIQPLMLKPIDQHVKEQFIQKDPFVTIFNWLLQLESKQLEYDKVFQLLYEFKAFGDESDKQIILNNTKSDLNLPLIFRKNWIPSMVERFKTIKELLKRSQSTNHQELFNSVHPLSSEYYNKLSINHNNDPIEIIKSIYELPIDDDILINKYNNFEEYDYQPNIQESILELIKYKKYNENEDSKIFYKWSKLIFNYLNKNQIKDFQFHESWYINKISILFKIIKYKSSKEILENIILRLNIIDSHQVFSFILNNQFNQNVCNNIEFLFQELKMDINILENKYSLLDLAINNKNFQLFIIFLKLGFNKSIDENKFNDFYQTLSHNQKLDVKPYLLKLFNINNKINWKTSLNHLLPKTSNLSDSNINSKVISTINGDKRIISDKYWDQLFSSKRKPNKCNEYGSRSVVLIEDEYGNGIYVKFYPQLPGTEISINKLSELLFGFLTPICELASIDNIPILLIQQIPGDTLIDALKKDKDIINKIESSNLSKQLVFSMISNNGDGNLANFIVVPNNKSYNIYSIDNDQSFMPPISKSMDIFKKTIQVETVLLLFNQMNDKVHNNVINCIKHLDINKLLDDWLDFLIPLHECAIEHFGKIKLEKDKETIIGISFNHGLISQLYSKLKRLQQMLNEYTYSSLTHLEVLETIEPLISDRIKPIISSNLTIIEKYSKLKKLSSFSEKSITCSTHASVHLLESRLIPNSDNIRNQLLNGKYGPSQALEELKLLKVKKLKLQELIKDIININHKNLYISNFDFESLLESDSKNIKEKSSLNKLYDFIKLKEPSIINLRDNQHLNIQTIIQFKLDTIVKLDLSGCKMLKSFENSSFITSKLFFKCLIKLILNGCNQLNNIKIKAPVLKYLNASNCKSLKIMDIESPNLLNLNLKDSISKNNIDISKTIENFKKLENLNISGADNDFISIESKFLKCLNINLMDRLKEAIFELPTIEAINIDGCSKLNVIQSKQDFECWNILKALYNPSLTFNFKIKIYPFEFYYQDMLLESRISTPIFKSITFINSFLPLSPGAIPSNIQSLIFSDDYNQPISPGSIPSSVQSITFGGCFDQRLLPGTIPSSVQSLIFGGRFDQPFSPGTIPSSVQSIAFGYYFNQPLSPGMIPSSVQSLTFGYDFNQPLSPETIPSSVQSLTFGYSFNQPLSPGIIPSSVQSLTFGRCFNQRLSHETIPSSIQSLTFGYWFNQPIFPGTIPSSVQSLTFGYSFDQSLLHGTIPSSVQLLTFGDDFNKKLTRGTIPSSVQSLTFGNKFNQRLLRGTIPSSVQSLTFGYYFNQPLSRGIIPSSVKSLTFGYCFNQTLSPGTIPSSVQSLTFGSCFNQPLSPGIIPSSVQSLTFGYYFNQTLSPGTIPSSVQSLIFQSATIS